MVFREDVSVDWNKSPRIITVAAPSVDIIIQDLHDTLRILEERPWEGLTHPQIVDTAGKEELGGGVTVGLTAKLVNAILAFEGRKIATVNGTITTTDASGRTLIDSTATFITDGIEPGAWIINFTDGSKATVLTVVSETELTTDVLGDGADNQFAINDVYKVQNVVQCEVSGGNLVAVAADGITPISAILPTVGIQVVRTSSSSATLQELSDIQYSSFNGYVTINVNSIYSGTDYPIGTPRQPVNNLVDALTIASGRGFTTMFVIGDLNITAGNFHGMVFIGESKNKTAINISSIANVQDCEFYEASISGTLDGGSRIFDCAVGTLSYVDGFIQNCILSNTITLSGNATAHFLNCFSGIPGASTPTIDMGGSGSPLAIRNYNGGIKLTNKSGAEAVSIDMNSGQIILDSTVTNGDLIIRGVGLLTDNSTGTANVVTTGLLNPNEFFTKLSDARKYALLAMINTS